MTMMMSSDDFCGLACPPLDMEAIELTDYITMNLTGFFHDVPEIPTFSSPYPPSVPTASRVQETSAFSSSSSSSSVPTASRVHGSGKELLHLKLEKTKRKFEKGYEDAEQGKRKIRAVNGLPTPSGCSNRNKSNKNHDRAPSSCFLSTVSVRDGTSVPSATGVRGLDEESLLLKLENTKRKLQNGYEDAKQGKHKIRVIPINNLAPSPFDCKSGSTGSKKTHKSGGGGGCRKNKIGGLGSMKPISRPRAVF